MVVGFQSYKLYNNDAPKNVDSNGQVGGRIGKCSLGVCLRSDEQKITTTPSVWNFSVALKAHVLIQTSQVYSLQFNIHACITPHFTIKSMHGRTYQFGSFKCSTSLSCVRSYQINYVFIFFINILRHYWIKRWMVISYCMYIFVELGY